MGTAAVAEMLRGLGADQMIVGHNVHVPAVSTLHGGRVIVFDPGMSHSILDAPASALEMTGASLPIDQRRVRSFR